MRMFIVILMLWCIHHPSHVLALGMSHIEHMSKQHFLEKAFGGQAPDWNMLRMNKELKNTAKGILGHGYAGSRVRYWHRGSRTAWIMDEIGKEYPITMGFVVENEAIVEVRILVYREERGGEVHEAFFVRQFEGVTKQDEGLSRTIDGITGATLSVDAVTRMAELVLTLHKNVQLRQVAKH